MAAAIKPVELQLGATLTADEALKIFGYKNRDRLTELRQADEFMRLKRGIHYADPTTQHIVYFERTCRNYVANWCNLQLHWDWVEQVLLKGK